MVAPVKLATLRSMKKCDWLKGEKEVTVKNDILTFRNKNVYLFFKWCPIKFCYYENTNDKIKELIFN